MRLPAVSVVLCAALLAAVPARGADAAGTTLRARAQALLAGESVAIAGEELRSRVAVPKIYERTGFRLLWREPGRLEALLAAVRDAADDGLRPADYHLRALTHRPAAGHEADTDLLATDAYVMLLYDLYFGRVDPLAIEPNWNLPRRPLHEPQAVEFVVEAIESGTIVESAGRARPGHWLYAGARAALARYRSLAHDGGWGTVPAGAKLEPGATDLRVPMLRQRLAVSGDYAGPATGSTAYDAALVEAVQAFQRRHLLTADGTVGPATLRELNVPVAARINQMRVNLERDRWVLHDADGGPLVVVDIAGFRVLYVRDQRIAWEARAIVGQPARQTPVFRAEIDNVVINPTWTVPPGILARDILPQMQRGENVLERKRLAVYDRNGEPVDPATVRWQDYTAQSFPYVLRQDAGEDNALGRLKINFPNPHLVYLHDTPTRALFERSQRTFSSGCIRIERPLELVELLLDDPVNWNGAAIRAAIDAAATRTVRLARKVPVVIMYWTMQVDADGRVIFKPDVYRRDPPLLRALDGRFSFGTRVKA